MLPCLCVSLSVCVCAQVRTWNRLVPPCTWLSAAARAGEAGVDHAFTEVVLLEALALNRREPLALLRRLGFHPAIAGDMVEGHRSPEDVMRHSLFHCGYNRRTLG